MSAPDADARRALAGWVRYLRDIGVRDLAVGSSEGGTLSFSEGVIPEATGGVVPPRAAAQTATPPASGVAAPAARVVPPPATIVTPPEARVVAPPVARMAEPPVASVVEPPKAGAPITDPVAALQAIRDELGDCTRCKLCVGRTNIVFGVGDPHARLMFVGEGPGADEDLKGEPFVGRAGQKLNEMIRAIGLTREQIYIANVVKCRPPDNRTPEPEEIATCSPFLFRQIEAIAPTVIVALGAPATRTLTGSKIGITQMRGHWASFRGIPVMPTFHPAYLLRAYTVDNRRLVFEDLKAARARLDTP